MKWKVTKRDVGVSLRACVARKRAAMDEHMHPHDGYLFGPPVPVARTEYAPRPAITNEMEVPRFTPPSSSSSSSRVPVTKTRKKKRRDEDDDDDESEYNETTTTKKKRRSRVGEVYVAWSLFEDMLLATLIACKARHERYDLFLRVLQRKFAGYQRSSKAVELRINRLRTTPIVPSKYLWLAPTLRVKDAMKLVATHRETYPDDDESKCMAAIAQMHGLSFDADDFELEPEGDYKRARKEQAPVPEIKFDPVRSAAMSPAELWRELLECSRKQAEIDLKAGHASEGEQREARSPAMDSASDSATDTDKPTRSKSPMKAHSPVRPRPFSAASLLNPVSPTPSELKENNLIVQTDLARTNERSLPPVWEDPKQPRRSARSQLSEVPENHRNSFLRPREQEGIVHPLLKHYNALDNSESSQHATPLWSSAKGRRSSRAQLLDPPESHHQDSFLRLSRVNENVDHGNARHTSNGRYEEVVPPYGPPAWMNTSLHKPSHQHPQHHYPRRSARGQLPDMRDDHHGDDMLHYGRPQVK